ncbi:ATP-dependent DNA ligase Cdc17 [Basidiobolus ranarum]|uniref:DNA ligase n=1 Tax=Basidiobolus ranarum TaxID=34480 RepID=A0ABR2WGJ8_9FUNG
MKAQQTIGSFFNKLPSGSSAHTTQPAEKGKKQSKLSFAGKSTKKTDTSKSSQSVEKKEEEPVATSDIPVEKSPESPPVTSNKRRRLRSRASESTETTVEQPSDDEKILQAQPKRKIKKISVESDEESVNGELESDDTKDSVAEEEEENDSVDEEKKIIEKKEAKAKATKVVEKKAAKVAAKKADRVRSDIGVATWKKGEDVPYSALCKAFEAIEATTKRLIILDYLTSFFRNVIETTPGSLLEIVYLCINRLCPQYDGLELGIGETILMKAVASATGRAVSKVKADVEQHGDLGLVAQASRSNQPTMFAPKPLTVSKVFKTLKEIASTTGGSSMQRKIDKISFLLVSCKGSEAKYLTRSLEGKLRIGLAEQTVLVALAHSIVLSREGVTTDKEKLEAELTEAAGIIKSVYSELPSYDLIIPKLLEHGLKHLHEHCKLTAGIPVKPMLAHPTKSLTEVLNRFEGHVFTCEFKYDGERAQIHQMEDGKTMVFSRNSEDMSAKYPDILDKLSRAAKPEINSFILDCEAVAWDREKNCILPFQVLSTRKRKDVKEEDIKVQVCVFAFDLLFLNGKSLLQEPLIERRKLLLDSFNNVEGDFTFAKSMSTNSVEEIQTFLD